MRPHTSSDNQPSENERLNFVEMGLEKCTKYRGIVNFNIVSIHNSWFCRTALLEIKSLAGETKD
jgi:hypothetical protein